MWKAGNSTFRFSPAHHIKAFWKSTGYLHSSREFWGKNSKKEHVKVSTLNSRYFTRSPSFSASSQNCAFWKTSGWLQSAAQLLTKTRRVYSQLWAIIRHNQWSYTNIFAYTFTAYRLNYFSTTRLPSKLTKETKWISREISTSLIVNSWTTDASFERMRKVVDNPIL